MHYQALRLGLHTKIGDRHAWLRARFTNKVALSKLGVSEINCREAKIVRGKTSTRYLGRYQGKMNTIISVQAPR